MMTNLAPKVLEWARRRAGLSPSELAHRLGMQDAHRVEEWERTGELTVKQAESLAEKTHTPFGYLFLGEPPIEKLPINDFRTLSSGGVSRPSVDLLDTIYQCQQRQAWYREYLVSVGAEPLPFVGQLTTEYPNRAAKDIRDRFQIGPVLSAHARSWEENLSRHFEALEDCGVLVMRNGVVGNNGHRRLSVDEFRGFALSDSYAPLIFINSRDAKAAQLFTLVHELVHVCLGESAVSNPVRSYATANVAERYCNSVAAEVLAPMADFEGEWVSRRDPVEEIRRLCGRYKVSSLVIARRAKDAGFITEPQFRSFYEEQAALYKSREERSASKESGGDFHNTLASRASSRFCQALITSTVEGSTTYKNAFKLLGISNTASFQNFAHRKFGFAFG